ncbi:MAG: nitronate monooxygenase, partial [Sphingomonadales bacterium]
AKLMCFAPTAALAKKLVRSGVDAIIIEGSEAGGHIGPVSTTVLAQEILPVVRDVPVFVAGGIGRGSAMAAFLDMGASGVQLGTRFAAASESVAHDKFKAAFVRASARDAIASVQVDPRLPVIPVRALKNASTEAFMARQREVAAQVDAGELDLAAGQLAIEHYWAGALRRAVVEGDVDTGSLMAGQSVGMVTKVEPVATIIADLVAEAEASLQRAAA